MTFHFHETIKNKLTSIWNLFHSQSFFTTAFASYSIYRIQKVRELRNQNLRRANISGENSDTLINLRLFTPRCISGSWMMDKVCRKKKKKKF